MNRSDISKKIAATARSKYAKLTQEQVNEIRNRYALGESQSEIARSYCVSQTQIRNIVLKKQWVWSI